MCNTVNLQRIYIISRKRYRQSTSRYWHLNLCSLSKQAVLKLLVLHKRKYYWRHKLRLSPQSCRRRCFEFLSNDFFPIFFSSIVSRKLYITCHIPNGWLRMIMTRSISKKKTIFRAIQCLWCHCRCMSCVSCKVSVFI